MKPPTELKPALSGIRWIFTAQTKDTQSLKIVTKGDFQHLRKANTPDSTLCERAHLRSCWNSEEVYSSDTRQIPSMLGKMANRSVAGRTLHYPSETNPTWVFFIQYYCLLWLFPFWCLPHCKQGNDTKDKLWWQHMLKERWGLMAQQKRPFRCYWHQSLNQSSLW